MKNILKAIFAFYGLVLFIITLLIVILPIFVIRNIEEPKRGVWIYKIYRVWMQVYLFLIGVRVEIKGLEHFKKDTSYVITANHKSFLDIMITVPFLPGPNKTLAKIEMAKIPLFGLIYKVGSILVDRKDEKSRRESLIKMQEVLERGQHLCLYPEGTRNRTKENLSTFYPGAFATAIHAQKDIIPCVLLDTDKIMPVKPLFSLRPGKIKMHFLPAISVENYSDKDKNIVKDKVYNIMWEYIEKNK